jgi:hypothetical protein
LPLVHENFEIVLASFREYLGAHGCLESVSLGGFGPEAFGVEFDFVAGLIDVPGEEGYIRGSLRASNPSGVLIMTSSLSSFS